jgi:NTE family protein
MSTAINQPIGAERPTNVGRGPAQLGPRRPRQGIALCLSGGGYRAAIFHAGALRRLNELGVLAKVDAISCVSGGSIIGGYLARLILEGLKVVDGRYDGLESRLARFFEFMRRDIRTLSALARLKFWEPPGRAPRRVERYYEDIVGKTPLASLPERPRFVFCATNLFFADSWVCERNRMGDFQAGYVKPPPAEVPLARAMAWSSCFPPVFDPPPVGIDPGRYSKPTDPDGHQEVEVCGEEARKLDEARRLMQLTDGGVYDNLGLEPVWKSCQTVLVSDGGKPLVHEFVPAGLRLLRYTQVIQNQVLALRKRWLMDIFERAKQGNDPDTFNGAYWGIMSATRRYRKTATYGYSKGLAAKIANIRTDLNRFSPNEIAVLEKHGYELADIAIKTHAPELAEFPEAPLRPVESPKLLDEQAVAQALAWSSSLVLSMFTPSANSLLRKG